MDLEKPPISLSVESFKPLRPSDLPFNRTTLGQPHDSTAYSNLRCSLAILIRRLTKGGCGLFCHLREVLSD